MEFFLKDMQGVACKTNHTGTQTSQFIESTTEETGYVKKKKKK